MLQFCNGIVNTLIKQAGKVAQLVKCLLSKHESLSVMSSMQARSQVLGYVPVLGKWRQEDQEFKAILSYILNSMSALAT